MDEIEAMMAELAKRHGRDGMQAIATLMHDFGSETLITFADRASWCALRAERSAKMTFQVGEIPGSMVPVCSR